MLDGTTGDVLRALREKPESKESRKRFSFRPESETGRCVSIRYSPHSEEGDVGND